MLRLIHTVCRGVWTLVLAGITLYGEGVTAFLLARIVGDERWAIIAFTNNFVPWLALGSLIGGGIVLLSRRRWLLLMAQGPGIIAFVVLYGALFIPRESPAGAADGLPLRVATYNLAAKTSDEARVVDVIAALDTDLIALHELNPVHAALIEQQVADRYPYRVLYPSVSADGTGLLSRYPVLAAEPFEPVSATEARSLRVVLDVNGTPVVVYVFHAHSPLHPASPLRYDVRNRDIPVAALVAAVQRERDPVLVLCDCNMSDQSDAYHRIDTALTDTFREVGRGMGFTFALRAKSGDLLPFIIRIDYVWHSGQFVARAADVWDDSGSSDHRPVVADLILEQRQ